MRNALSRVVPVIALATGLVLTGCSSSGDSSSDVSPTPTASTSAASPESTEGDQTVAPVVEPILIIADAVSGAITSEARPGQPIVIVTSDPKAWTAEVTSGSDVVEFVKAQDMSTGGVSSPSFVTLKEGAASARLTNTATGKQLGVTFTIAGSPV